MKAHLKIFADPGERSDIVRVSFGIVRGMERVSGVNCVYFLEQTVGKRLHLMSWKPHFMRLTSEFSTAAFSTERKRV